jgi:hypothetical protein
MTITYWPGDDISPVDGYMDLIESAAVYTDPRSRATLRQATSQPAWSAQWTFQNLCPEKWRRLTAFLRGLRGPINTVRLFDWSDQGVLYEQDPIFFSDGSDFSDGTTFDEAPLQVTVAAAAGAESITVRNLWTDSITLPQGSKIGLPEDRVYILPAEVTIAASGTAAVALEPLFQSVSAGAKVVTYRPTARFFRASFTDPMPRDLVKLAGLQITFSEEIR